MYQSKHSNSFSISKSNLFYTDITNNKKDLKDISSPKNIINESSEKIIDAKNLDALINARKAKLEEIESEIKLAELKINQQRQHNLDD